MTYQEAAIHNMQRMKELGRDKDIAFALKYIRFPKTKDLHGTKEFWFITDEGLIAYRPQLSPSAIDTMDRTQVGMPARIPLKELRNKVHCNVDRIPFEDWPRVRQNRPQ